MTIAVREFTPADAQRVLELNAASVHFLSPLDDEKLAHLARESALFWVAETQGEVLGFLIAFTTGANYQSVNYRWFDERLKHFLYIDRIVLCESARGCGLGQKFYDALSQWALQQDYRWLAAEIDIAPANPQSLRFHEQQKFVAAGEQAIGSKRVSLQIKSLG